MKVHPVGPATPAKSSDRPMSSVVPGARSPNGAPPLHELLPEVHLDTPDISHQCTLRREGDSQDGDDSSNRQATRGEPCALEDEAICVAVSELGGMIAAFCLHPSAGGADWNIRIPLDAPALRSCVLHMHVTYYKISLRFETTDWDARSALIRHGTELVEQLRSHLPQWQEIVVLD